MESVIYMEKDIFTNQKLKVNTEKNLKIFKYERKEDSDMKEKLKRIPAIT
jgi:hypothetical protein